MHEKKSLVDLARWANEYEGTPNPWPFVVRIRDSAEPRETWNWMQDLLLDESNSNVDISRLLLKDKLWSDAYSSVDSVKMYLGIIRGKFLGASFNMQRGRKAVAKPVDTPPRLVAHAVIPPAPPAPDKRAAKISMALDLGLSKETLVKVLTELV